MMGSFEAVGAEHIATVEQQVGRAEAGDRAMYITWMVPATLIFTAFPALLMFALAASILARGMVDPRLALRRITAWTALGLVTVESRLEKIDAELRRKGKTVDKIILDEQELMLQLKAQLEDNKPLRDLGQLRRQPLLHRAIHRHQLPRLLTSREPLCHPCPTAPGRTRKSSSS